MMRNLMVPWDAAASAQPASPLGVLDFQDALHGPITYDIASQYQAPSLRHIFVILTT